MEEVAFSMYFDWWLGAMVRRNGFQFCAAGADLQSHGKMLAD